MGDKARQITDEREEAAAEALMRALPGTVRVGPFDFQVRLWGQGYAASNMKYGAFSSIEQVIELQAGGMPSRYKAIDTFWHEVTHAIFWVYGIEDEDKEERVVSIMGTAIMAMHRDNPWLVDWIRSADL